MNSTDRALFRDLRKRVAKENRDSIMAAADARQRGIERRYDGDAQLMYNTLDHVARAAGVHLKRVLRPPQGAPPEINGWFHIESPWSQPEIGIITTRPVGVQTGALLHEEGHLFTPDVWRWNRGDGEVIAESAAWIVGKQLGFDMDAYSASYVANWSQDRFGGLRPERIAELEVPILTAAARLGAAVDQQQPSLQLAA